MNLLIAVVSLTLLISFLCSLLEAVLLSVSVASLEERRNQGRGIRWLLEMKQTRIDEAIGAILVLNTISHTLGASISGYLVAREFEDFRAAVGIFSALFTFLVLFGYLMSERMSMKRLERELREVRYHRSLVSGRETGR